MLTYLCDKLTAAWALVTPLVLLGTLVTVVHGIELAKALTDDDILSQSNDFIVSYGSLYFSFAVATVVLLWANIFGLLDLGLDKDKNCASGWMFCVFYALSMACLLLLQVQTYLVAEMEEEEGEEDQPLIMRTVVLVMFAPHVLAACSSCQFTVKATIVWLICLGSLISAAVIKEDRASMEGIGYYVGFCMLIFLCKKMKQTDMKLQEQQCCLVVEQEKAKELEAQEENMKHMVANVAHDLKTPLSSFMAGADIIDELVAEGLHQLDSGCLLDAQQMREMLSTTSHCLRNIRNTNNFMLMTINRCIDYTKASKGLKLVPKYETIDLMDTLSLPLNCMKDIQQRVSISMEPVSKALCSHVITDKQWLQENILCLLSNAVKYSSQGTVKVRMNLIDEEMDRIVIRSDNGSSRSLPSSGSGRSLAVSTAFIKPRIVPGEEMGNDLDQRWSEAGNDSVHSVKPAVPLLVVEVEDTGIGMTEEAMQELFSPFKQNQRLAGGTGLGLFSLAKRMEALCGKCGVMPRRDGQQGSLFWFSFPYKPDINYAKRCSSESYDDLRNALRRGSQHLLLEDLGSHDAGDEVVDKCGVCPTSTMSMSADPLPSPMPKRVPELRSLPSQLTFTERHEPDGTKPHILLVDDSPAVSKMTMMLLRRHGFEVTTADNGSVALNIIQEKLTAQQAAGLKVKPAFQFILMDLQMPVMDGLETTRRLRKMEKAFGPRIMSKPSTPQSSSSNKTPEANNPAVASQKNMLSMISRIASGSPRPSQTAASSPTSRRSPAEISMTMHVDDRHPLHHIVIGVSANDDDETNCEMRLSGFDSSLPKPFSMTLFHDVLDALNPSLSSLLHFNKTK